MSGVMRIFKVNSKPTVLQPSALYMVSNASTKQLNIYMTDKDGGVIYRSIDSADISAVVTAIINALKDQPGGLAGLDLDGHVSGAATNTDPLVLSELDPGAAAASTIKLHRTEIAGRSLPGTLSALEEAFALQPSLARKSVAIWSPLGNSTTTAGGFGLTTLKTVGTVTARTVSSESLLGMSRRLAIMGKNSSYNTISYNIPVLQQKIGGGNNCGGFYISHRFAITDSYDLPTARMFMGIRARSSSPADASPSTITNCIGIGHESGESNFSIYHAGNLTQNSIDLGSNFPTASSGNDIYELALYSPPKESNVYYQLTRLTTGDVASGVITGTPGLELPDTTTLLSPLSVYRNNGYYGGAPSIDAISLYVENF